MERGQEFTPWAEHFGNATKLRPEGTSGADLTSATTKPRVRKAHVKSKAPLEIYI